MAKEILAIPEEHLPQFLDVLAIGITGMSGTLDKELKEYLSKWHKETCDYIYKDDIPA